MLNQPVTANQIEIFNSIPSLLAPLDLPNHKKGMPPLPAHLLDLDNLTIDVLAPRRFFSVAELKEMFEASGETSIDLIVSGISYELTTAPDDTPAPEDWQLCLSFENRGEKLVMSARSRLKAFRAIAGTSHVPNWVKYIEQNNPAITLYIDTSTGREVLMLEASSKKRIINETDEIPF